MSAHGKTKIPGEGIVSWLEGFGVNAGYLLLIVGIPVIYFAWSALDVQFGRALAFAFLSSPLWLPWILFFFFFHYWMEYVQLAFDLSQGRTTLEIIFPQEVFKSPLAMELVLIQLYQTASPDNHFQTYWDGKHPPVYGLEIVSDGGRIHFYINTPKKKFKNMWETQLYAQYPGIVVKELPIDYTASLPWDPSRFAYFALHFKLKKPDPYPIKTYIDFGLDKDPKEEFKIDPITSMLELLGSIGPKEKIWVQILISAHREETFATGSLGMVPDWKDDVKEEIEKIMKKRGGKGDEDEDEGAGAITPRERDIITALERSVAKYPFTTKIRSIYAAEKDAFAPGERIGAIISMWRAFDDVTRNAIGFAWRTDYDWNMWQDPKGKRAEAHKERELGEYKTRSYTSQGGRDTSGFIMTTEELATIFHPAGQVVLTPTLERVTSARAEAPANLPRGEGV